MEGNVVIEKKAYSNDSTPKINFLNILKLLEKHDTVLHGLLSKPEIQTKY